jgi:assimilatory nitrate reductase catalytic subunit
MFSKWTHPEAAFKLIRDLTVDRPCDITGVDDYEMIDQLGGIQWPFPASMDKSQVQDLQSRRLFENGVYYTPNGKAKILFSPPAEMPEAPDSEYPFLMLTGRGTSSQWHTQTRTGKSDILKKLYPENVYLEIHPDDARKLDLQEGDAVIIRSRRGEMTASAYLAPTVQQGQIFIPMHYREVNQLTHAAFDPHSRQPNYKACAVALSRRASPSKKF